MSWEDLAGDVVTMVCDDESLEVNDAGGEYNRDRNAVIMMMNALSTEDGCPPEFADVAKREVLIPDGVWGDQAASAFETLRRLTEDKRADRLREWQIAAAQVFAVSDHLRTDLVPEEGDPEPDLVNGVIHSLQALVGLNGCPPAYKSLADSLIRNGVWDAVAKECVGWLNDNVDFEIGADDAAQ